MDKNWSREGVVVALTNDQFFKKLTKHAIAVAKSFYDVKYGRGQYSIDLEIEASVMEAFEREFEHIRDDFNEKEV